MVNRFALLVFLLCFFSINAFALDLKKKDIEVISRIAHDAMKDAKISGDGDVIGEKAAKKLVYPLIPFDERKETIIVGNITGFAATCGLNWQDRSFLPFMSYMRQKHTDWTPYQFAYVGMLHGVSMGMAETAITKEDCTAQVIKGLEANLKKK